MTPARRAILVGLALFALGALLGARMGLRVTLGLGVAVGLLAMLRKGPDPVEAPALAPAPPVAPPPPLPLAPPVEEAPAPARFLEPAQPSVGPDMASELLSLRERLLEDKEQIKRLLALALDLRGNLAELAARGEEASRQNAELLEGAERDGARMATEIQTLVSIKDALREGTAVIDDLANSSREVGPVIESIFVVARKTNMLALNAAIEAARAGEQGRGFAVVADEVRRLAEAATASTHKVERFVEGLRERTASAIVVLKGASRIEESIPVVYRISDAFVSLVPSVESANRSLGDLAELVQENVREVGRLREVAEAGLVAADASISQVDHLLQRLPPGR